MLRSKAVIAFLQCLLMVSPLLGIAPRVTAETIDNETLLAKLQKGGQVIVMRHASSPRAAPDKKTANADNKTLERQLDETGRTTSAAMGNALREFKVPVTSVLSSPTYRALETIKQAKLPTPQIHAELGDGGQSMQGVTAAQVEWLQKQAMLLPSQGNTFIVTHLPNITAAFPQYAAGIADGEALVFGADGQGRPGFVARIKIEDWSILKGRLVKEK
jgi:phosphohistidine phosphatase SixA